MGDDVWIVVPKWDKFQHYTDRDPVWIKLYTRLVHDADWLSLTHVERSVLVMIWLEFALADGVLSAERMALTVHRNVRTQCIESLQTKGFIELSASKPLALARTRVRSREKEKETDSPKSPHRRNPDERMFARPDTVCPDCGETLGAGHLQSCPRMPQLAGDLLKEARQ